ncbi:TonB-dependent receptor [Candidatus Palauibacter sp.]|uniref:TonB-dependent receptor n=1 Tax=Candidatus Palauibacter sp. TaxID=3101350 RepID=UPI003B0213C2
MAARSLAILLGLLPFSTALHAQDGTISGRVLESSTGRPVDGAIVSIEGSDLATLSDSTGAYRLVDIPPGPQVIRVRRIGFADLRVPLTFAPGAVLFRDLEVATRAIELEGLSVTVDPVGRARGELATASVIDLEAIQNQTATSLAGILELLPGVPLQPPGLGGVQQFALRSAATSGSGGIGSNDLASFGTVIILDGIPVSNNANLQSLGSGGGVSFTTSAGGGIDLRKIPANTLERVEVIRGLPSVRYGDLTQGAVVVDTRAGEVPPEIAGQFDAETLEGTFLWGTGFGSTRQNFTLALDMARTRSQPGIADDEAVRVAGQLSHRLAFGGPRSPDATGLGQQKLTFDTRLDVFQLFDDRPEDPNIRNDRSSKVRDRGIRASERARLWLGEDTRLSFTGSITVFEQDSEAHNELVRGALPVTTRLTEGRQEGSFVLGPYVADVEIDGGPRLFFGRLELETRSDLFSTDHRIRVGVEPRREWNSGRGRFFDITRPPYITFTGVRGWTRPRSYEDIGDLVMSGWYVDDRVTVGLGGQSTVQLQGGLRLDLLHEGATWFDGVRDAFLQPRMTVELAPVPWLRLKGNWGRVAKAPTLSRLFPGPKYYDLINVNQFTNDPAERLAVLTTFIRHPTGADLGWVRATKAEAGFELSVGGAEISLVAFRDRIRGGVGSVPETDILLRESFALTDSIIGNGIKPGIIEPATHADTIPILIHHPRNIVEQTNRGIELIAALPELRAIRTRALVTGALVETEQIKNALDFGGGFGAFQIHERDERHPFFDPALEFGKRAMVTYRMIHHQPELGLVLTATIQHNITDEFVDEAAHDSLAFAGYITRQGELVRVPVADRGLPEYQDLRVPRAGRAWMLRASPADWMLSFQVSKTLPLNGQVNLWFFNAFDRRGAVGSPDVRPRLYPDVQFGLEVLLPLHGVFPALGGGG